MDEILKNVAKLGFTIVVAVYLLMRTEGKIVNGLYIIEIFFVLY